MSSILQMQAQYESLATQYRSNLAEMSAGIARHDEGLFYSYFSILLLHTHYALFY
jgi:hypothetical protein